MPHPSLVRAIRIPAFAIGFHQRDYARRAPEDDGDDDECDADGFHLNV
jgi:hypothetical protein